MSSSKYCAVCRSGYRSSTGVHYSTARHRSSVHAAETRITGRGRDLDAGLGYRTAHIGRALAGDRGDDKVKVRQYRRRLPLDGPRKVVKVDRYWRDQAASYIDSSGRRRSVRRSDYA